jgi:hypothetical protein
MNTGIGFTRHAAFGWVVHRKVIPAGNSYSVNLTSDTDGLGLGNITVVTKGLITGVNRASGQAVMDRAPGYSNKDRVGLLAGTYDFTAQEPSEWWCINQKTNKGRTPNIDVFCASAGEVVQISFGTKLFLCQGSLSIGDVRHDAPQAFQVESQQAVFVADEQCYGFIFKD